MVPTLSELREWTHSVAKILTSRSVIWGYTNAITMNLIIISNN